MRLRLQLGSGSALPDGAGWMSRARSTRSTETASYMVQHAAHVAMQLERARTSACSMLPGARLPPEKRSASLEDVHAEHDAEPMGAVTAERSDGVPLVGVISRWALMKIWRGHGRPCRGEVEEEHGRLCWGGEGKAAWCRTGVSVTARL
eukprot:92105-Chlamydomonas_euryale.AAC.1